MKRYMNESMNDLIPNCYLLFLFPITTNTVSIREGQEHFRLVMFHLIVNIEIDHQNTVILLCVLRS